MKKLLGILVLGLLWCNFINTANANIYWVYEFYKISPQSNIFIIGDSGYQECLKSQLSEKEYNKAIKIESNMSKKMEKTADTCVEKLLISQKNPVLQECLKNELSEERYNNLIVNSFSKKPKKNDFKAFQKCLFNLKTLIVDNSSNQPGSCPEGYILENNTCQPDQSKKITKQQSGTCPEGYILKNNTCQPDKSKKVTEQKSNNILSDEEAYGSKKSYADMWLKTMDEISALLLDSEIQNKQKYLDIVNNAISIFRRMESSTIDQQKSAGKQLVEVINLLEKDFQKHKNVEQYKDVVGKISGIMTGGKPPVDIFLANKVYDCKSYSEPFFTHNVTDLSKIKKILPWGSVRSGGGSKRSLKSHTYMVIKNKGSEVSVHVPTDSYLIASGKARLHEFKDTIHYSLIFQASCDVVYYFFHLDKIEPGLQKKMGELALQEIEHKAKFSPIRPPIFIKGGELVAKTKGVPKSGWWDFGLLNKNNNNKLPKRIAKMKFPEAETKAQEVERFGFADCPYDYFTEDLKKAYYKKISKKRCGPKEIK